MISEFHFKPLVMRLDLSKLGTDPFDDDPFDDPFERPLRKWPGKWISTGANEGNGERGEGHWECADFHGTG